MKHDFKAVLDGYMDDYIPECIEHWAYQNIETIRLALAIAHKLTQEPSEGMIEAGMKRADTDLASEFKAMAAELIKEAEGEMK